VIVVVIVYVRVRVRVRGISWVDRVEASAVGPKLIRINLV